MAINYEAAIDEMLTVANYFVVEEDDHLLSDVLDVEEAYDVSQYKGGAAVDVTLKAARDGGAPPAITVAELEQRIREVGLLPEFEENKLREWEVHPLGAAATGSDDKFSRFAVLAVDESTPYSDSEEIWATHVGEPLFAQVDAALAREKSLAKVVQFAGQIAKQTQTQAIFAIVVALAGIVAYVWLRFGTKEYGFAAIVALVHDVSITLGLMTACHFIHDTAIGKVLLLSDFKLDLPMIAALMTVIGYSLNDTIVVFDRIRENRGKVGSLTAGIINTSINQTLARTVLTSITTFIVVITLYIFGGAGIHGFSFALLIGVVVGTYSSIGVATPLLFRPRLLHQVVLVIVGAGVIGTIFVATDNSTTRIVLSVIALVILVAIELSGRRRSGVAGGQVVRA